MKKKAAPDTTKAEKPTGPTIGDYVYTPISDRAGKIVKSEDKMRDISRIYFSLEGLDTSHLYYKEYTIEIPVPCLRSASFKDVTIVLCDSEISKKPM